MQTYRSNGKLLLTAEYVVLDGAKAIAIPTKLGQTLAVSEETSTESILHWEAFLPEQELWFRSKINLSTQKIESTTNQKLAKKLLQIFQFPEIQEKLENKTYTVKTELEFPKEYGFGTSSTLINNLAQWFKINAFELQEYAFGGSGYDIACANHEKPISYQLVNTKPTVKEVVIPEEIQPYLNFVYLNQKQNSREGISQYQKQEIDIKTLEKITNISNKILKEKDRYNFQKLILKHQNLIERAVQLPNIQQEFSDFSGVVKNLGAWGGDFILAVAEENPNTYFKQKGYPIIFQYSDLFY